MAKESHFTTRRGFIAAMGFGGVSLYGLWAAYGAAPTPLALLGLGHGDDHGGVGHGGGHGGHGAAHDGPSAEEFSRTTNGFIERYRLPDGTVHPRLLAQAGNDAHDHGHGHDHDHGGHGAMDHGNAAHDEAGSDHSHDDDAIDVYLAAGMWYYLPGKLRLDAGQPYRFKMMALDVAHGASIQFGRGGRMVRLRPGRVTEMDITFHEPGRYLVYCTMYCGPAHDVMQATIEVV
jgi:plastocyanin